MSDRNDYLSDPRFPPPDLTDEAQFLGLGPRDGDEMPNFRAGRPWGKTFQLRPGDSLTAVATEAFGRPVPIALRFRFSGSINGPFVPLLPVSAIVNVDVIQSLDLKSGSATETFSVGAGQPFPVCIFLARSISVVCKAPPSTETPTVFLQVVACPVQTVDCAEVNGAPSYGTATVARVATAVVATTLLAANQRRQQFSVFNNSTQILALKFGPNPSITSGAESYTRLVAAGGVYESPIGGWGGIVTGIWAAADATGEALVTEGV